MARPHRPPDAAATQLGMAPKVLTVRLMESSDASLPKLSRQHVSANLTDASQNTSYKRPKSEQEAKLSHQPSNIQPAVCSSGFVVHATNGRL